MQVGVVVLVIIVAAALLMTARHRTHRIDVGGDVTTLDVPGTRRAGASRRVHLVARRGLRGKLDEWVQAGLISPEQAEAILRREEVAAAPEPRIPLVSEAIGYIGGALVVAAVALLVGRRWDELDFAVHVLVFATPAILFVAAGWWIGRGDEPALIRLGSLLWVLSCAGVAGTLAVVFVDGIHDGNPPEHGGVLFVAGITALPAAALWAWRRLPLQHLAFFAATLLTVVGTVDACTALSDHELSSLVWGLAIWGFGVVWASGGHLRILEPALIARILGVVTALVGAQIVAADARTIGMWLGAATAALLIVGAVQASLVPELVLGTAGAFQWTPQLALYYLADTFGAEASLFVVGVLFLALAALLSRAYRRVLRRDDATRVDARKDRQRFG